MKINFRNNPIHIEVYGEGKPLILLHGFLENSQIWNVFIPLFKKSHKVICIDLFGHGQTPKLGYIHKMETMAEAVSTVMESLEIPKASLIGHSMGGYVISAFLEKFPEKTERVMFLNSTATADSEQRKKEREQVIKIVKKNKGAFVQMAITNLFAEENRKRFKSEIQHHIAEANKIPTENIVATLKGMKLRKDRTEYLKDFSGEKIIVTGTKDTLIPLEDIQKTVEKTDSKLIIFEGGHMGYIENKAELEKVFEEFIS